MAMFKNCTFFPVFMNKLFKNSLFSLVHCDEPTTCNDNGMCQEDGKCVCYSGYYGNDCLSKHSLLFTINFKYMALPFQSFLAYCNFLTTCNGNGVCNLNGTCECFAEDLYGTNCLSMFNQKYDSC